LISIFLLQHASRVAEPSMKYLPRYSNNHKTSAGSPASYKEAPCPITAQKATQLTESE